MDRIKECLAQGEPNYLYPFLIVREMSKEDYIEEIEAIHQAGCGGLLVENRGYKALDERWWADMDIVMEEARKRNMKVWMTDDITVPSGKAGWAIRDKFPELRRKSVAMETIDMVGPQVGAGYFLEPFLQEGETVLGVIAYRMEGTEENCSYKDPVNLTDHLQNGVLFWDVPAGFWRMFLIVNTQVRRGPHDQDYCDFLNPESCQKMIEYVHEPHYQRYKEYVGNTWEGFFTDETLFGHPGNGPYDFCEKVGQEGRILPWKADLPEQIAREEGWTAEETLFALPGLWRDIGGKSRVIRHRYMDIVTRDYSENFVKLLGQWCAEHGLLHTGHNLEDMNAHMRLGVGTGHLFRSQQWQHTSGFDLVLQQLKVGNRIFNQVGTNSAKYQDPGFYLYTVGRLGASIGHLYPHMQGRVMCENGGAGGWSEGLSTRKYMLDAMMVAGGNMVVPAVFDPLRNNNHIPPFVYDHGQNPQYPFQKPLMEYVNRLCHVMSGGVHRANALVYYPAEGDWCGDIELMQHAVTPLAFAHVDYDFASFDLLEGETLSIVDGKIRINQERFDALVVPCCDFLPEKILKRFDELAKQVPVIFADKFPKVAQTYGVFQPEAAVCMPVGQIPNWFKENGFVDYRLDGSEELMHLHISHPGTETYLFFNVSAGESIDAVAAFPYNGTYTVYDAWDNTSISRSTEDGKVRLRIPPRGTLLLRFGGEAAGKDGLLPGELDDLAWKPIAPDTQFAVTMQNCDEKVFQPPMTIAAKDLRNLAPEYPYFAGTLRYTATISTEEKVQYLDLGTVGELAKVTVNGVDCGALVCTPFRFCVAEAWKTGDNFVEITIASNCGYRKRERTSRTLPMPPTGLVGPVSIA